MILLSMNFHSHLSQVIAPKITSNPENQPLSVLGNFYQKVFGWLAGKIEEIISQPEEGEMIGVKKSPGVYEVKEGNQKIFETHLTGYCTCNQFNCQHAKYVKSLNGKLPKISRVTALSLRMDSWKKERELVEF